MGGKLFIEGEKKSIFDTKGGGNNLPATKQRRRGWCINEGGKGSQ